MVGGRIETASRLGVDEEQIAIDPGLDFDLTTEQDLEILRRLGELRALGLALYVSLSRKDFIGAVLAGQLGGAAAGGRARVGDGRGGGAGGARGADILRIHDRSSLQAVRVAGRIVERSELAKSLFETPWAIAIDPARRDGRIVAESSRGGAHGEAGGDAALARPRPGRGAGPGRDRAALLAPARGAEGGRLLATW